MRSSPRSSLKVTTSLADKMADPVSEAALTDGDGERERVSEAYTDSADLFP